MTTAERPDLLATCWTTAGDAVPLGGRDDSPIALPDRIAAAARAGFTGFGVVHNDLATYLRDGGTLPTLRDLLADHGMRHVELEFLTGWWETGTPARAQADRVQQFLVTAAEVLQPHHVKVGPDITGGAAYELDPLAEQWNRISQAFADAGTVIALEFMAFSNVSTVERAVELVRTAGHPAGGLMIDLWHIMRGGGHQLEQVADVPLEYITGVELDDGSTEPTDDGGYVECVLRRKIPGHGDWPVPRLIRILQDKGWAGPWGIEILAEDYRVRPLDEALADVVGSTLDQFALAEKAGPA